MARYRMTAARRAALRKAQIASAKKRRRQRRAFTTAAAIGAIGGGALIGAKVKSRKLNNEYAFAHAEFVQRARARGRAKFNREEKARAESRYRQSRIIPQYGTDRSTFGRTRPGGGVALDNLGRQRGNKVGLAVRSKGQAAAVNKKRAFKTNSKGMTKVVGKLRGQYDLQQRLDYDPTIRHVKYINWDKPRRQQRRRNKK